MMRLTLCVLCIASAGAAIKGQESIVMAASAGTPAPTPNPEDPNEIALALSSKGNHVVWASSTYVTENADGSVDAGVHDVLEKAEAKAAVKNVVAAKAPKKKAPKTDAPTGFPTLLAPDPTTDAPTTYPTFMVEAEAAEAAIADGGDDSDVAAAVAQATEQVAAEGDDYVERAPEEVPEEVSEDSEEPVTAVHGSVSLSGFASADEFTDSHKRAFASAVGSTLGVSADQVSVSASFHTMSARRRMLKAGSTSSTSTSTLKVSYVVTGLTAEAASTASTIMATTAAPTFASTLSSAMVSENLPAYSGTVSSITSTVAASSTVASSTAHHAPHHAHKEAVEAGTPWKLYGIIGGVVLVLVIGYIMHQKRASAGMVGGADWQLTAPTSTGSVL